MALPQQLSYPFCLDCAIAIRLFTHSQLHNYPNKIISPGALAEITRHVALGYTLHSGKMPRLVEIAKTKSVPPLGQFQPRKAVSPIEQKTIKNQALAIALV